MQRKRVRRRTPHPSPSSDTLSLWERSRLARYSTVTDFARFRGWSTSVPRTTAV